MSSTRLPRSASVASKCSIRFFSRITCCERCGFDHKFGSAACFSISVNCGRSLPASKILPKLAHFRGQRAVFLFELLNHEEILSWCPYEEVRSASAAPLLKLSHTGTRTSLHAACRMWFRNSAQKAQPARRALFVAGAPQPARTDRSKPSLPYPSRSKASGHSRSPSCASGSDAARRLRCRHTSHRSKY